MSLFTEEYILGSICAGRYSIFFLNIYTNTKSRSEFIIFIALGLFSKR